jgi:hypothetical protein
MEPVFMVLGQSAATAAAHALEQDAAVQDIDYARLRERLLADNLVLVWTGPKKSPPKPGLDPTKLLGIVIDEEEITLRGFSMAGHTVYPYVGSGYRHDGNSEKGFQSARFPFSVPTSGRYDVRVGYSAHSNRASNVPVSILHAGGQADVVVNQKKPAEIDNLFHSVGTFSFQAGAEYEVKISNHETDGYVILDAIQLVRAQ